MMELEETALSRAVWNMFVKEQEALKCNAVEKDLDDKWRDSDRTDMRLKVAVDWKRRNAKENKNVLKERIELVTQLLHKLLA